MDPLKTWILAHGSGAPHGHTIATRGFDAQTIAFLAGAAVILVWWLVIEFRASKKPVPKRKNLQAAMKRKALLVRAFSGIGIAALVALAVVRMSGEIAIPIDSTAKVEARIADDAEVPITVSKATAGGSVEMDIENPTPKDVRLVCTIDAFGADGGSVMTGSYRAFEPNGTEYQSDIYATSFVAAKKDDVNFGVDLVLSAEATNYEVDCWRVEGAVTS